MNRKAILLGAATLPLFLIIVVFQAIQYQELRQRVASQERLQYEWIEKNKKLLAGVTVLGAPQRIQSLVESDAGLKPVGADRTLKVDFGATNGQGGQR